MDGISKILFKNVYYAAIGFLIASLLSTNLIESVIKGLIFTLLGRPLSVSRSFKEALIIGSIIYLPTIVVAMTLELFIGLGEYEAFIISGLIGCLIGLNIVDNRRWLK